MHSLFVISFVVVIAAKVKLAHLSIIVFTFMLITCEIFQLHKYMHLCTMDVHINSLGNILIILYLAALFLLVTFVLIAPETFMLDTSNFTHISIYILCICTSYLAAIFLFGTFMSITLEIFVLKPQSLHVYIGILCIYTCKILAILWMRWGFF